MFFLAGVKPLKIKDKVPLRGSFGFPPDPPSGSGFGAGAPRRRLTDGRRRVTLKALTLEVCLDIRLLNGVLVNSPKIKWYGEAGNYGAFDGARRLTCGIVTGGKVY